MRGEMRRKRQGSAIFIFDEMADELPQLEGQSVKALTFQSMKRSYEMFATTPAELLPLDEARF